MTAQVGDILRITAVMQWAAQDIFTNQYYFQLTTQNEATDTLMMDKIANAMDAFYTIINPHITQTINYISIDGQNITQDVLLPSKAWPVLVNGGGVSDALPTQLAALVYYKTLRPRTRAGQYLPPMEESANTSTGAIQGFVIDDIQDFGNDLVAGILELSVEAVLGAYNPELARFTPVILAIVPPRWRTQRRRRLGVGS